MILKHVALYTKGHYQKSGDLVQDLIQCLIWDGFGPETIDHVLAIISRRVCRLFSHWDLPDYTIELIHALDPEECWKYGYYTKHHTWAGDKDSLPEYDYRMAVLYFYLSKLQGATVKELGGLPEPDPRVLPLTNPKTETV